jgi:fumarate reductase subunit C
MDGLQKIYEKQVGEYWWRVDKTIYGVYIMRSTGNCFWIC